MFLKDRAEVIRQYLKYVAFAVCTGVIVYLTLMSLDLVNNLDGIWHPSNFIAGDWEISLGRGLQRYADRARFGLVSGAWNSALVFLLISVADCLIIEKFKFKDTFFSYLFVFISIANPVVSESLSYSYMSVNFGLAYFFSAAAFFFADTDAEKEKKKLLWSIGISSVLFGISMAFYQAYIGLYAVLAVIWLLNALLSEEHVGKVLKELGSFLVTFILGGLIYYAVTALLLLRADVSMADYKGANNYGVVSILTNLPKGVMSAYRETFQYIFNRNLNARLEFSGIMIALLCILLLVVSVVSTVRSFRKNVKNGLIFLLLLILLPAAASCVCIIAVGNTLTGLMAMGILMGMLMFYVLGRDIKAVRIAANIVYVIMAWFLVSAVVNDQIALKEGITATKTMAGNAILNAYSDNLTEEADCVAFVGRTAENPAFYKSVAYEMANEYAQFGRWSTDPRNNRATWMGITESLCGVSIPICGEEAYANIVSGEEVKEMPVYPNEGYMRVIDNVLVIKMSDLY